MFFNTCAYPHKEDSTAHTSSEDPDADDHDSSESSVEDDTESSVGTDAEPYGASRGALSSVEDGMLEPRVVPWEPSWEAV